MKTHARATLHNNDHVPAHTAQELCERRGGRPGLPVTNSPYGLCRRKATLNSLKAQMLCESRGGRPGLPVANSLWSLWT